MARTDQPASFEAVPVPYKFFQASSFFPMPVMLVSTTSPEGVANLAPYSLCFPQPALGERAMLLICREGSNTARYIEATAKATLCFFPDQPELIEGCKLLGKPGTTEEKMARSIFTLMPADAPDAPAWITEAVQLFECTWDPTHPHQTPHGDCHYSLRVDRVLLTPRWKQALDRGWGYPQLPVDYGFKNPSSSWLSRVRASFDGPALRPRFTVAVDMSAEEALDGLRRALEDPDTAVEGNFSAQLIQVDIPRADSRFWSPQLEVVVSEDEGQTRVRGRIGPHPSVWMLFIGLHLIVGMCGVGGLMYGLSLWGMGESPWPLWSVPAALLLHAFIAGAAFVGQGLGADHVFRLRGFVEDALRS